MKEEERVFKCYTCKKDVRATVRVDKLGRVARYIKIHDGGERLKTLDDYYSAAHTFCSDCARELKEKQEREKMEEETERKAREQREHIERQKKRDAAKQFVDSRYVVIYFKSGKELKVENIKYIATKGSWLNIFLHDGQEYHFFCESYESNIPYPDYYGENLMDCFMKNEELATSRNQGWMGDRI